MSLYLKLISDDDFIDFFSQILERLISHTTGQNISITHKKYKDCVFFFIDESSILQIIESTELRYTYAHVPSYEKEIKKTLEIVELQWNRNIKIDDIIKKES